MRRCEHGLRHKCCTGIVNIIVNNKKEVGRKLKNVPDIKNRLHLGVEE